ncbi:hypothetical protein GEV33_002542 [Tenebrio molitor]|uniref:Endonuclease/exonuclease/phosphatase domain-containing protein n=1 Tax=Tenebrio molitor TaxID=7067 RepID=A0A8J6HT93_TENMO|nr:hypothetical protein GEV33_002542 [Tenebrio molitor]
MHGKKRSYRQRVVENNSSVQQRDEENNIRVEDIMKKDREECMLVGGDFNGRIAKDKVENAEGKRLMEWIEENGWEVLNGSKQVDKEEKWTYVGSRGETVIDYAIVNEKAWKTVEKFTIAERWKRRSKGGAEEGDNKSMGSTRSGRVQEYVEKMEAELKEVIEKKDRKEKWLALREQDLLKQIARTKRTYRESYKEKKKQRRETEEKEIKEIRTQREVWKYLYRERKEKESVSEEITMQEWEEYFKKLLEGRKGGRDKERQEYK